MQVVLATCHSAGGKQLNNINFDVCIIDEATQAVEAVCWVPILKSRRLILAGDPQQVSPLEVSTMTLTIAASANHFEQERQGCSVTLVSREWR